MLVRNQQLELDMEQQTGSKSEKSTSRLNIVIVLNNLYIEHIMRNARLLKHKLESRLLGEISITSDMHMTPTLWQKVKN